MYQNEGGNMSNNNKLKNYGKEVLERIGYEPISSSIKPVHIANGLFRLIIGEEYTIEPLNAWSKRFKDGKEISTSKEIRSKYSNIIGDDMDDDDINKLRSFLELIFNADNSATPSVEYSTLTISSRTQVTKEVQNEYKIPNFIYKLLNNKKNGYYSSAIDLVKECLNNEDDELSRVVDPIVKLHKSTRYNIDNSSDFTLSGIELRIRDSFDRLTENELRSDKRNKLLSLERVVLLACFSIILHLSSRILDISDRYNEMDRIPILLDSDGSIDSIKYASQETLKLSKLGIEEFFEKHIEKILRNEGYDNFTHEKILERINEIPLAESNKKQIKMSEEQKRANFKKIYEGFYEQSKDSFDAIVKATRFILFSDEYFKTDPSEFISSFGRRIGLIKSRGRGRNRYSPDPLILEIVLLSTIEFDQNIKLSDFGDKLWEQYGIIIGANPEKDYNLLEKWNIAQNTPGDLAGSLAKNADKIIDIYIAMGYGKRYADGVTVLSLKGER